MRTAGHLAVWLGVVSLAVALGFAQNQQPSPADADPAQEESDGEEEEADESPDEADDSKAQQADEVEGLPKRSEMTVPSVKELLQEPPVDWIVLKTDEVLVTEPVYPRPKTLEKMQQKIEASFDWPRPKTPEERKKQLAKRQALYYLNLVLPEGGSQPEYKLHIKHVEEIIYHEDLMLQRIDQLLDEGDIARAFEMLLVLDRRPTDWPGLQERKNRILFEDARAKLEDGQVEHALALLEDLRRRKPTYRDLQEQFIEVAERLISRAFEAGNFRESRHFFGRLQQAYPEHPVTQEWKTTFLDRSKTLLGQARSAADKGQPKQAAIHIDQAAAVWPRTPGLKSAHRRFAGRYQRLQVGLVATDSPAKSGYFLPTIKQRRHRRLRQIPLFEVDRIDESPHYETRFFEKWEPIDLGRRIVFSLRPDRRYWESQPVVTATAVAATFAERMDPQSPFYNERFASFVDTVAVHSPFEFEVRFGRIPLRTEALFQFPLLQQPLAQGGDEPNKTAEERLAEATPHRFQRIESTSKRTVYRRRHPEPDGLSQYHIAEIIEQRYSSRRRAVQGLLRGEVSLLPRIPHWNLEKLRADGRFFIEQYALPLTHILQPNPKSEVLQNRELRRALVYGLNRTQLLQKTVLHGADAEMGRVVSAPFPNESYAYNSLVEPRRYDPALALSLTLAARKQLGGEIRELKLLCPPDTVTQAVAEELVAQWGRLGIDVKLLCGKESAGNKRPEDWDLIYRTVRMTEPLVDLWPLLTFDPQVRIESLTHLPTWMRREVIALENAGDWKSARDILHQLHSHLWAEAEVLPLFEVDQYMALRKNISGFPSQPVWAYQGIERWTQEPWYETGVP